MASVSLVATLLFCIIFSSVHAHDWMITPIPRGGVPDAQTVNPCEAFRPDSVVNDLTIGSDLSVSWGNGHKTGTHDISTAVYGKDTTVADFTVIESVTASQTQQPQVFVVPAAKLPSTLGNFTLRWSWSGFDNCATVRLIGKAPSDAEQAPAGSVNPVTNTATVPGDYLITDKSSVVGVYNAYTGQTACKSGYSVSGNGCKKNSSGMSTGGKAVLALFLIALVGTVAWAGFSYHKNGHVFGITGDKVKGWFGGKKTPQEKARAGGAYTAYAEPSTNV